MTKHTKRIAIALVLVIVICGCFATLISCDSSGGPRDSVSMESFRNDTTLNLNLHIQRLQVLAYQQYYPIKCRYSLGEIYDKIKNTAGYDIFMRGDYIMIDDRAHGASWTIGKAEHKSGIYKYNYYITNNMVCKADGYLYYMFPIYALTCEYKNQITHEMQEKLSINCGMDEFVRFYKLNRYDVEINENVLTIYDNVGILYMDRDGNTEYKFDEVCREFHLIFDNKQGTVRIEFGIDYLSKIQN